MIRALGLSGSPRRGGNTDLLLDSCLEGVSTQGGEVTKRRLNDMEIRGCQACNDCFSDGNCIIDDDMQEIYTLLEELDILIIASPIFFSGLSSQTKAFVDRCQSLWARKHILHDPVGSGRRRLGAFLSVGARNVPKFDHAVSIVKAVFDSVNVEYFEALTIGGCDEKGAIKEHPTALDQGYDLGERIALECKKNQE